jgi:hypothetical protein
MIGVTLGRCGNVPEKEDITGSNVSKGDSGNFEVIEIKGELEAYSPPSYLLNSLKSRGSDVLKNPFVRDLLINQAAFFHGEMVADTLIQLMGGVVNVVAPGVGSVLASSATVLNHCITFAPLGSAARGIGLSQLGYAIEPQITPFLNSTAEHVLLPVAKASWWAIGKTAPMAWDFTKWLTTKGSETITDYTKLASRWANSSNDFYSEEIEMS